MLVAATGCLLVGGLVMNDPPLNDPPGFWVRLKTYLTSNVAETRRDHPFPELELRTYLLPPERLLGSVERALIILDWELVEVDPQQRALHAVVSTPLFKFKDDVEVRLVPERRGTELHIRSASRLGVGDLGANTRHILNLLATLENLP